MTNIKVMLANVDYRTHTTNEGDELQNGMGRAGWILSGVGFDGLTHVPTILEKYKPSAVLVHDKRDFDPSNIGCFRKDIGFTDLKCLQNFPGFVAGVVKDAGPGNTTYHRLFCEEIGAKAIVTYYHARSVNQFSPWMERYPQLRTYHSVDGETLRSLVMGDLRMRGYAVITGAVSSAYPLRQRVIMGATKINCAVLPHPGYSNKKNCTPEYLNTIAGYRVHVATASAYGFALRKIIESVAVGTTPVTDLPLFDRLPFIDGAIVRVPAGASIEDVDEAVRYANANWNLQERLRYAELAARFYDWREMGARLDRLISAEMQRTSEGKGQ